MKNRTLKCPICGSMNPEGSKWCVGCGAKLEGEEIMALPPGFFLDRQRFRINGYLGHGESAITYRAQQRNFYTEIAVREYFPADIAKRSVTGRVEPQRPDLEIPFEQGRIQFMNEGNRLRSLGGIASLVAVHDVFEDNGTIYMVEDLVPGRSLEVCLREWGPIPFEQAVLIMDPIMKALATVHSKGIIHRDIKPSNIIMRGKIPCLIDFGIAREIRTSTTKSGTYKERRGGDTPSLTRVYSAPESVVGTAVEGPWTDVYSVAAVLYRMVTGKEPDDVVSRLSDDRLPPPYESSARIQPRQSDVIMRGLALDTVRRYQNMEPFRRDLIAGGNEEKLADQGEKRNDDINKGEDPPPSFMQRLLRILAVLAALLLCVIGITFIVPALTSGQKSGEAEEETGGTDEGEGDSEARPTTPVTFSVRLLDCLQEPLANSQMLVSRVITDENGNTNLEDLWMGTTDADGYSSELEANLSDDVVRVALVERGLFQEISMEDIRNAGGMVNVTFPFHFYPETYWFRGHTYALGKLSDATGLYSFDAVEAYCESLGGHLTVIDNAEENDFLFQMACEHSNTTAFFGYSDQESEGDWKWVRGDSSYTNWTGKGSVNAAPDNGGPGWGPENYAEFNAGGNAPSDGTWNDAMFGYDTTTFIIEWDF